MDRLSTAVTVPNRFTRFFRITLATALSFSYGVRRKTSVDRHYHARDKSRSVGEEPDQGPDQVVRQAVPAHGRMIDHLAGARGEFPRFLIDVEESQLLG